MKLQPFEPVTLSKRDSETGAFLGIWQTTDSVFLFLTS